MHHGSGGPGAVTVGGPGRMDAMFDTPAFRVLRHIARTGPVKMREFVYVSGSSPKMAKILRERLAEDGYLVLGAPERRVSTDLEIALTPTGRRLAEIILTIEELTDRAKRKHPGATDRRT